MGATSDLTQKRENDGDGDDDVDAKGARVTPPHPGRPHAVWGAGRKAELGR